MDRITRNAGGWRNSAYSYKAEADELRGLLGRCREFILTLVSDIEKITWNFDEAQRDPIHETWRQVGKELLARTVSSCANETNRAGVSNDKLYSQSEFDAAKQWSVELTDNQIVVNIPRYFTKRVLFDRLPGRKVLFELLAEIHNSEIAELAAALEVEREKVRIAVEALYRISRNEESVPLLRPEFAGHAMKIAKAALEFVSPSPLEAAKEEEKEDDWGDAPFIGTGLDGK